MAALTTTLLAAGLAISAAGAATSFIGQAKQTTALKQQEALRKKQMTLDAMRQRREVIRNGIVARSKALFAGATQGAQFGSGVSGGQGEISSTTARKTGDINQNEEIGQGMFAANYSYYTASGITGFGSGMSSLGNALMNNAGTINNLAGNPGGTPSSTLYGKPLGQGGIGSM